MQEKKDIIRTINRLRGQMDGIGRMVEEERDWLEIATQIKAVTSGMNGLNKQLIEQHMRQCCQKEESREVMSAQVVQMMTVFFKL
jgi:DNA-binding FrmR family transcriptional regulator